jgi:hypothetical protein
MLIYEVGSITAVKESNGSRILHMARSEGEMVNLVSERGVIQCPPRRWYQTFEVALDGRIPPGLRVVPTSHSLD